MGHTRKDSGSAFFLILIGIFMFASISYFMMSGSRQSAGTLAADQARIEAQSLISFANAVVQTVQSLKLRGCTDTEMDFRNAFDTLNQYVNPLSPSDGTCRLFGTNGGKMNYAPISTRGLDPTMSANIGYSYVLPTGNIAVDSVGTTEPELTLVTPYIQREVCIQINKLLGVTNPSDAPPVDGGSLDFQPFIGVYAAADGISGGTNSMVGKSAGCVSVPGWGNQMFYIQVLIAR